MDRKSEFKNAAETSSGRVNAQPSQKRALSALLRGMDNFNRSYHAQIKRYIEREIIANLPDNFSASVSVGKLDFGDKCLLASFHRYKASSILNMIRSPVSYMNWRIDFNSKISQTISLYASGHKSYTNIAHMEHESSKFFKMSEDQALLHHRLDRITLNWIKTGFVSLDA